MSKIKVSLSKLKRAEMFFFMLFLAFFALMVLSAFVSKGLTVAFTVIMTLTGGTSIGIQLSLDQFKEK